MTGSKPMNDIVGEGVVAGAALGEAAEDVVTAGAVEEDACDVHDGRRLLADGGEDGHGTSRKIRVVRIEDEARAVGALEVGRVVLDVGGRAGRKVGQRDEEARDVGIERGGGRDADGPDSGRPCAGIPRCKTVFEERYLVGNFLAGGGESDGEAGFRAVVVAQDVDVGGSGIGGGGIEIDRNGDLATRDDGGDGDGSGARCELLAGIGTSTGGIAEPVRAAVIDGAEDEVGSAGTGHEDVADD